MKKSLRDLMVESVCFMATGMDRKGLPSKKVRAAEWHIRNWKFWFVKYMAKNPLNEQGAKFLGVLETKGPMGVLLATQLADKTILVILSQEQRAIEEGSFGPYFERSTLSWVEYCRWDEMPPVDEYESTCEDVMHFTKELGVGKNWTPDNRKMENYHQLLSLMIKYPEKKGMVLFNASRMMKRKAISKEQMDRLCAHANYITKEKVMVVRMGLNQEPDVQYVKMESEEGVMYL